MSGHVCRSTLCLTFKLIKNMKLGAHIESLITKQMLCRLAIALVNDADFYFSSERFRVIMQLIIGIHARLYEATGGKMQQQKIMYYC